MTPDNEKYTELRQAIQNGILDGGSVSEHDLKFYTQIWDSAAKYPYADSDTGANWALVKAMAEGSAVQPSLKPQPKTPVFRLSYMKWAAVVVLAVGLGWATISQFNKPATATAEVIYKTHAGETKTVTLADGSVITLNAGSVLTVLNDFNNKERNIRFDGEAFFDIARNTEKPFTISHGDASVTVLGTSFNMECYAGAPLKVALKTGKVRMSNQQQFMDIVPGETGIYDPSAGKFSKAVMNPDKELGWMNDKMVFENESLRNVITELERKYGVTFAYDKNLDNEKITVTFDKQSLDQVVSVLQKTMNSTFTYSKN